MQFLKPQKDVTWWNVSAACWSLAELTSAITCACLPTFKPLVARIKPLFVRISKDDSTVELRFNSNEAHGEANSSVSGSHPRFSEDPEKSDGKRSYGTRTWVSARDDL